MDILQMVKEAQSKLRATQINWQEECLFDCDDILTGVIRELEQRPTTSAVDSAEIPEVFNLEPKVVATGRIVFDDPPSN